MPCRRLNASRSSCWHAVTTVTCPTEAGPRCRGHSITLVRSHQRMADAAMLPTQHRIRKLRRNGLRVDLVEAGPALSRTVHPIWNFHLLIQLFFIVGWRYSYRRSEKRSNCTWHQRTSPRRALDDIPPTGIPASRFISCSPILPKDSCHLIKIWFLSPR